jgi:hypothetical protein
LLAAIGVGPLVADFAYRPTARQHIHNPNWPPHAKFHNAQYIAMSPLISGPRPTWTPDDLARPLL